MSGSNKSEKPTPRRQQKAREQGQVARSRELANTLACVAGIACFIWQAPGMMAAWRQLLGSSLDLAATEGIEPGGPILFWNAWNVIRWVVPPMGAAWIVSVTVSLGQGGFVLATGALAPKLERMSPGGKLKQMFSAAGVSGLLKSILPFAAIGWVSYSAVSQKWGSVLQASTLAFGSFVRLLASLLFQVAWKSALVLVVWAAVDYYLVWRKLNSDLMMSREELREEVKETEGNPAIKGRIRALQRQLRKRQMLRETEKATVVIVNPTHFAVALRYEMDMDAPVVLAKGRDLVAQKIKEIARWREIPVIENPPLAQALYRSAEVGQPIPAKLYTAVAEILAVIYRAQAQARQKQAHRPSV